MSTPKFTPTKWKMKFCQKHKHYISGASWRILYVLGGCATYKSGCDIIDVPNVPFKIPELQLIASESGWMICKDTTTGARFPISSSELVDIINKFGFPKGGIIKDQWWMWRTVGGAAKTLHLLVDEE